MALPDGVTLVDAFPFDSNPDLITDVNGYLAGDRSVDAWTMQNVFKQFFSDGVFGTPADALQIKKGASGLTVTIEPGMFIIHGGMGGIKEDAGALTLTLDTQAAAGNLCYGIMLRYDNNPDMRGLGFRVAKGTAGADPQPPAPDQTSENVMEYRLGYVEVPNGATDLSNATVHNEKGLDVCPYAAPFEEIDVDGIVTDFREQANVALEDLQDLFDTYKTLIESALDETTAGLLQTQINEIKEQLSNFDLSGSVDDETIKYGTKPGVVGDKLYIPDGAVTSELIADGAVTSEKVSQDLSDMITKPKVGKDIGAYSWDELIQMAQDPDVGASGLAYMVGQMRRVRISGYGSVQFQLIGIMHDDLADGSGKASMTFMSVDCIAVNKMNSANTASGGWNASSMKSWLNNTIYNAISDPVKTYIKQVKKQYNTSRGGTPVNSNNYLFLASEKEVFGTQSYDKSGTQYDYWTQSNNNNARIKSYGGSPQIWWLRSVSSTTYFGSVNDDGSWHSDIASSSIGVVPCFCI